MKSDLMNRRKRVDDLLSEASRLDQENLRLFKLAARKSHKVEVKEAELMEINFRTEEIFSNNPKNLYDIQMLAAHSQEVFRSYFPLPLDSSESSGFEFELDVEYELEVVRIFVDGRYQVFTDLIEAVCHFFPLLPEYIYFQDDQENLIPSDLPIRATLFCGFYAFFADYVPKVTVILANSMKFEDVIRYGQYVGAENETDRLAGNKFQRNELLYEEIMLLEKGGAVSIETPKIKKIFISPTRKGKKAVIMNEELEREEKLQGHEEVRQGTRVRERVSWVTRFLFNGLFMTLVVLFQVQGQNGNLSLTLT